MKQILPALALLLLLSLWKPLLQYKMPYQKKLQKTYGSIESQVQPGSSYNNGGVGDGGGFGNPSKYNLSSNNNNVSFILSMQEFILLVIKS